MARKALVVSSVIAGVVVLAVATLGIRYKIALDKCSKDIFLRSHWTGHSISPDEARDQCRPNIPLV